MMQYHQLYNSNNLENDWKSDCFDLKTSGCFYEFFKVNQLENILMNFFYEFIIEDVSDIQVILPFHCFCCTDLNEKPENSKQKNISGALLYKCVCYMCNCEFHNKMKLKLDLSLLGIFFN